MVQDALEKEIMSNLYATAMAAHSEGSPELKEFKESHTIQHVRHLIVFVAFLGDVGLGHLEALRNCKWGKLAGISNHPVMELAFLHCPEYKLPEGFGLPEKDACFPTTPKNIKALLSKVYALSLNADPRQKPNNPDSKRRVDKIRLHIVYYHFAFAAWCMFSSVRSGKGTRVDVPAATMCALFPVTGGLSPTFEGCMLIEQLEEDVDQLCVLFNDQFGEENDAPPPTLLSLLGHPWYLYALLLCSLNLVRNVSGDSPWPNNGPRLACQKLIDQWHFTYPTKQSTKNELALRGCVAAATNMRKAREFEEKEREEQKADEAAAAQAVEQAKITQEQKEVDLRVKNHLGEQVVRKKLAAQSLSADITHRERCDFIVEAFSHSQETDSSFESFENGVTEVLAGLPENQSSKKAPKVVWIGLFGLDFGILPDWEKAVRAIWKHKQNAQIAVHLDHANYSRFLAAFENSKTKSGEGALPEGAVAELPFILGTTTESLAGVQTGREDAGWGPHANEGGSMVHSVIVVLHRSQKQMATQLERRASAVRDKSSWVYIFFNLSRCLSQGSDV